MKLLTVADAAEVLRVSKARVYELARLKLLPVVHLGRQVRISEQVLHDWIKSGGKALD